MAKLESTIIPNTTGMTAIIYQSEPPRDGVRMPGRCTIVPIVAWEMLKTPDELPRAHPILPSWAPEGEWGLVCPNGTVLDSDGETFASVDAYCSAYSPVYHFEEGPHPANPITGMTERELDAHFRAAALAG